MELSIIVPVFNEAESIVKTLEGLKWELSRITGISYEILVVNDGSRDKTGELLSGVSGIKVINHPYNKGYGASIKTGMRNARYSWFLLFDGDGQHNPGYIKEMINYLPEYDMIVGSRTGKFKDSWARIPAKKLLGLVANYLAERKIPDLNSGFRLIKKEEAFRFLHLLPDSFSLSTTITLAFLKDGLNVKYLPVEGNPRVGQSKVRPPDALRFFMLILRIIFLFSPLRIFLPASIIIFTLSFVFGVYDVFFSRPSNISDATTLLFVTSLLLFFFGLLADQIAAIRREIGKK